MPNIKSAKKRVLVSKVNNERNKMAKSALKTTLKKFEAAVAEGNKEQADSAYTAAVKSIDQAVKKGIIHKNTTTQRPIRRNRQAAVSSWRGILRII